MNSSKVWYAALALTAVFAVAAPAAHAGGGGVSSHIVLPAPTLVAGATERGTLVIGNSTGRPIRWDCAYLEVQLTNAHYPLVKHPTPCGPARTIPVGTTRLRFTLRASREVCKPTCRSVALPPGTFHTQLLAAPSFVHPLPITVHVVAQRSA